MIMLHVGETENPESAQCMKLGIPVAQSDSESFGELLIFSSYWKAKEDRF